MKVFNQPEPTKKSWALRLTDNGVLVAADSVTGEAIATILYFFSDGMVCNVSGVEAGLRCDGYDAYEHGIKYDDAGRVIITND